MAKETESIPLSEAISIDTEGFKRNYMLLMEEDNNNQMKNIITDELLSNTTEIVLKKTNHKKKSSKGGQQTAQQKKTELKDRNDQIKKQSIELLDKGREKREIAGILATQFNLTPKRIREILSK